MSSGIYYDLLNRGFLKPEDHRPPIDGFEFYIDAFRELSTTRPSGLEMGAIPFTAIAEYFNIYGLSDFDEFVYLIRLMDNTLMRLSEEANKAEGRKNASSNTNPKGADRR